MPAKDVFKAPEWGFRQPSKVPLTYIPILGIISNEIRENGIDLLSDGRQGRIKGFVECPGNVRVIVRELDTKPAETSLEQFPSRVDSLAPYRPESARVAPEFSFTPERSSVRQVTILAEHEGVRRTPALVVLLGRATYFCGGSRTLNRQMMAPCLMHFEIRRKSQDAGPRLVRLMGDCAAGSARSSLAALHGVHARFGGEEVHLAPALPRVFHAAAYGHYTAIEDSLEI